MRSAAVIGILSAAFLAGSTPLRCQAAGADLIKRLQAAEALNSLDYEGAMPFHMKMTIQLKAREGMAAEEGTVETWWSGPNRQRNVFDFPSYKETYVRNADFRTAGAGDPPYLANYLFERIVHPIYAARISTIVDPELRKEKLGSVDAECILLNEFVPHAPRAIPPGVFTTYCLEKNPAALRVTRSSVWQNTVREKLSEMNGHVVATDVTTSVLGQPVAHAHVESLTTQSEPFTDTLNAEGLSKITSELDNPNGANVPVSKVAPVYPETARRAHIEGNVQLNATIGTDGLVYGLSIRSTPDYDLAVAAMQAVRQWKYSPCLVKGVPRYLSTVIAVKFRLLPGA